MPPVQIRAKDPNGFHITLSVATMDDVGPMIRQLLAMGYSPTAAASESSAWSTGASGDGWQRTPTGEPICGRHGVVMMKRTKQNQEWFSHRIQAANGEEKWCRGYRSGRQDDGFDA